MAKDLDKRSHQLEVAYYNLYLKYSNYIIGDVLGFMRKSEAEQRAKLLSYSVTNLTSKKVMTEIIDSIVAIERQYGSEYQARWVEGIKNGISFSMRAEDKQSNLITSSLDLDPVSTDSSTEAVENAYPTVMATPMIIGGEAYSAEKMVDNLEPSREQIIIQTLQAGYLRGFSTKEMELALYGSSSASFLKQKGTLSKTRLGALSSIQTTMSHSYQQGFAENAKKNKLYVGYQWVSVIDGRTSEICLGLDGGHWLYDDPDKSTLSGNIYPPAHYRCRSTTVQMLNPNLKSNEEWEVSGSKDNIPSYDDYFQGLSPENRGLIKSKFSSTYDPSNVKDKISYDELNNRFNKLR